MTDLLAYLGFERARCSFEGGDCYVRAVESPFDLAAFAIALPHAFSGLREADRHLAGCGILLAHPEGLGYFAGKEARESRRGDSYTVGDGHTGDNHQRLKQAEDANFQFVLTSLRSDGASDWTTHYRLKHEPISTEMLSAFSFLDLASFPECPEFDFETCFWRSTPYTFKDWGGNSPLVFSQFDAHPAHFSPGLEALLQANTEVMPFGMGFLPTPQARPSMTSKAAATVGEVSANNLSVHDYDVAISFAGPERPLAAQLAKAVQNAGFRVFYDDFYPSQLWGKNLVEFFDDVYRKKSRFCVMFLSGEYKERMWTTHERQSAQARALVDRGNDYILPIRVEDIELPGMQPTLAYLSLQQYSIDAIAAMLIEKLQATAT